MQSDKYCSTISSLKINGHLMEFYTHAQHEPELWVGFLECLGVHSQYILHAICGHLYNTIVETASMQVYIIIIVLVQCIMVNIHHVNINLTYCIYIWQATNKLGVLDNIFYFL